MTHRDSAYYETACRALYRLYGKPEMRLGIKDAERGLVTWQNLHATFKRALGISE